jgi:cytochrome c peroxidase
MKVRTKFILALIVLVVLAAAAMPLANLLAGPPQSKLAEVGKGDPEFVAAAQVLAANCAHCHVEGASRPFYAHLPLVKALVEHDVKTGLSYADYGRDLFPTDGQPVSEVVLAKLEHVVEDGHMPPPHYLALHWDSAVSEAEKNALRAWIHKVRAEHYATGTAAETLKNEPVQPIPDAVDGIDPRKVALGEKLFHDARLSKDNTVSCASCHDLAKGGCDREQYSTGVGKAVGGINSPTVFNSGLQFIQFWDGRAADLGEQAAGPVENPIEMAEDWANVPAKLQQDPALVQEMQAVYPEGITKETICDAIAAFEHTLLTPNSRFDRYLKGDEAALTADEKKGYELFKTAGCASCHVGKALGGQSFERMGRKGDYFGDRGTPLTEADYGRYNVTKDEADRYVFKTPMLRNIALTYPYFHDGSRTTLKDAVLAMSRYQMGVELSDADADLIVAFLNTLTGEYKGAALK